MRSILFFGDSLTAGYQLRANESFPARIQEKLDAAGLAYKAHNYGVSGETTAGGRQRIGSACGRGRIVTGGRRQAAARFPVSQDQGHPAEHV